MSDQDPITLKFRDAFSESVSFLDAPQSADVPPAMLAVQGTSNLLSTLAEIAKALGANLQAYLPQLKVALLAVYDTKIAPLDIPWIPNTIEPLFDSIVRQTLEKGIDALIAAQPTFAAAQSSAVAKVEEIRSSMAA